MTLLTLKWPSTQIIVRGYKRSKLSPAPTCVSMNRTRRLCGTSDKTGCFTHTHSVLTAFRLVYALKPEFQSKFNVQVSLSQRLSMLR